jgi:hypothetical protein
LQYGAIRFARQKKTIFGAIQLLRAIKRVIWRDSPFTRHYTLDWRDSNPELWWGKKSSHPMPVNCLTPIARKNSAQCWPRGHVYGPLLFSDFERRPPASPSFWNQRDPFLKERLLA